MNVAIIPARGGSRRIPRKNIRTFHGKPIIAYSIEAARASRCFQKIIVSTEDAAIAAVARAYGAKIHSRARRLADDITGTQEVMQSALRWWNACGNGAVPEFACCIYPTAPMMTVADLRHGYTLMYASRVDYGFVPGWFYWGRAEWFGVKPLETPCFEIEPERYIDIDNEEDWQRAERMYAALHGVPA